MNQNILSMIYHNNNFIRHVYKTFKNFKDNVKNNISGGAFSIDYKKYHIKFKKLIDDNLLKLYLSTPDENTNCISIIIDIKLGLAYIENVTNDKYTNCFEQPELNNGKTIMEISIKLLKKYKDKFNIKEIQLKDNSFITCDEKTSIVLSDLSFLQHNETFYSRFGFKPRKDNDYENYMKNKAILSISKVKKIKLEKILIDYNNDINSNLKKQLLEDYEEHLDYNIIQWFNHFSRIFMKKDCKLFKFIIEAIYKKLDLTKLNNIGYTMKL